MLVHFMRNVERTNTTPFTIKGKTVALGYTAKILGVVIDAELWYKQYVAKAATKGLIAAIAPRDSGWYPPRPQNRCLGQR